MKYSGQYTVVGEDVREKMFSAKLYRCVAVRQMLS